MRRSPGETSSAWCSSIPGANEGALSSLANGTRPDERRQTSSVSINGVNDVLNNQLVDGMDNNERSIGTVAIKPSIDAIAEVRVQTNMYTAETGRTLGGVINIITKSGGNAVSRIRVRVRPPRKIRLPPVLCAGQAGESAEPVWRQPGWTAAQGSDVLLRRLRGVPDQAGCAERGDRADGQDAGRRFLGAVHARFTTRRTARTPFAGNVIPAARFDPIAVKYMQLYPLPNGPGLANNFSYTNNRTQDNDATDVRIDHRFDDRNTVFARYSYNKTDTLTPSLCPPTVVGGKSVDPTCIVGGAATGNYAGPNYTTAHNVTGSYVRVLNATTIMEVKASYSKPDILSLGPNNNSNLRRFVRRAQREHGRAGNQRLAADGNAADDDCRAGRDAVGAAPDLQPDETVCRFLQQHARRTQPAHRRRRRDAELWRAPVEFGPGSLGLRLDADQQRRDGPGGQRVCVVPARLPDRRAPAVHAEHAPLPHQ